MAVDTYTPLFSEILSKVAKLKTKKEKVDYLQRYNTDALRMVPFEPNDSPEGTEHTILAGEARRLYNFIKGGNPQLTQNKREMMFVQLLEGLHEDEANLLVAAKDKKLHQVYKGLSANVVKTAFNWTDDYMINDGEERVVYPQGSRAASFPD